MKTIEQTRLFAEKVAAHQGWALNPDREFREMILEGLTANHGRYRFYHCPCRDSFGTREKDGDISCPCDYCRPDLEEYGRCFCSLFMTPAFAASCKELTPIPDRRSPERYP